MKKLLSSLMVLSFVLILTPAFAGPDGAKGAAPQAYEHASDQSVFNRVSDWFATVGKPEAERDAILAERKAKRMAAKVEAKAHKAEAKAGAGLKDAEKNVKAEAAKAAAELKAAEKKSKEASANAAKESQEGLEEAAGKL